MKARDNQILETMPTDVGILRELITTYAKNVKKNGKHIPVECWGEIKKGDLYHLPSETYGPYSPMPEPIDVRNSGGRTYLVTQNIKDESL